MLSFSLPRQIHWKLTGQAQNTFNWLPGWLRIFLSAGMGSEVFRKWRCIKLPEDVQVSVSTTMVRTPKFITPAEKLQAKRNRSRRYEHSDRYDIRILQSTQYINNLYLEQELLAMIIIAKHITNGPLAKVQRIPHRFLIYPLILPILPPYHCQNQIYSIIHCATLI